MNFNEVVKSIYRKLFIKSSLNTPKYKIGKKKQNSLVDSLMPQMVEIVKNYTSGPNSNILAHDDMFTGANSVILHKVNIGDKSIVEAGAVVTKNAPENTVPARVICSVDEYIEKCEKKKVLYEARETYNKLFENAPLSAEYILIFLKTVDKCENRIQNG